MRWMKPEPIIQSEVSNLETDIENRPMDMGEGRKEKWRCMDRVTWKFTIPYVK